LRVISLVDHDFVVDSTLVSHVLLALEVNDGGDLELVQPLLVVVAQAVLELEIVEGRHRFHLIGIVEIVDNALFHELTHLKEHDGQLVH